jgi:hypothetical protein
MLFITFGAVSCTCKNPSINARKKHKPEEAPEQVPPKILEGKQLEEKNQQIPPNLAGEKQQSAQDKNHKHRM